MSKKFNTSMVQRSLERASDIENGDQTALTPIAQPASAIAQPASTPLPEYALKRSVILLDEIDVWVESVCTSRHRSEKITFETLVEALLRECRNNPDLLQQVCNSAHLLLKERKKFGQIRRRRTEQKNGNL